MKKRDGSKVLFFFLAPKFFERRGDESNSLTFGLSSLCVFFCHNSKRRTSKKKNKIVKTVSMAATLNQQM